MEGERKGEEKGEKSQVNWRRSREISQGTSRGSIHQLQGRGDIG